MSSWLASWQVPWPVSRVGHHFAVTLGKMVNASKAPEDARRAPYLAAGSIQPLELVLDESKTMPFSEAELDQYSLKRGDVVVVEGGAGYGRSQLLTSDLPGWGFQNHVARVRQESGRVSPGFLLYVLRACLASGFIEANNRTATLPSLSREVLSSIAIPVPNAIDQRAIVAYLDRETAQIDTLIVEQQRLIDLLRERRSALQASSFAPWLESETGSRLKHALVGTRQGWSPDCYGWAADGIEVWAVLKAGAANGGTFRPHENKELPDDLAPRPETVVREGDVIVSRANTRDLVGSAAVVVGEYPKLQLCDKLYALEVDRGRAVPDFVAGALGHPASRGRIELAASGSSPSMQNVSKADILNLPLDLPDLDTQRSVVKRLQRDVQKVDALIREAERLIELARERRSALITAAVTGQIDIPEAS